MMLLVRWVMWMSEDQRMSTDERSHSAAVSTQPWTSLDWVYGCTVTHSTSLNTASQMTQNHAKTTPSICSKISRDTDKSLLFILQYPIFWSAFKYTSSSSSWIGLCSVLRPHQHSIGYMGDGFYRSKDPTNSIKVLKEMLQRTKQTTKTTTYTHMHRQ